MIQMQERNAYGFDRKYQIERNVLIFDLGGSNLSVSLLSLEDRLFQVRAINGNTHFSRKRF